MDRPGLAGLPRVGDYRELDWERLAAIRPEVLIVFMAADRMPDGLRQRAQSLRMRLVNVRTERLDDVYAALHDLGEVVGEPQKAAAAQRALRQRLETVARRVAGRPRVRTLIVREATADGVVGRDNFINDVLEIAGGVNVVNTPGWPSIDREMLHALKPDVVLQLLPQASPQVQQQARDAWSAMGSVPAVTAGRVYLLTDWWVLQPGMQLGQLAERFSTLLHGDPALRGEEARP